MSKNYLTGSEVDNKLGNLSINDYKFRTKRELIANGADTSYLIKYGDYDYVVDDDIVKKVVTVEHTVNVTINIGVAYIIVTIDGVDTIFKSSGSMTVDDGKIVYWTTTFSDGYEYEAPSRPPSFSKYQESGSFNAVNNAVGGGSASFTIDVNAKRITQTTYKVKIMSIPSQYQSVGLCNDKSATYDNLLLAPRVLLDRSDWIQAHTTISSYYDTSTNSVKNITDTTTPLYAYTLYGGNVVWCPQTAYGGETISWDQI